MANHVEQENHEYKIRFQILAQAPIHETNIALVMTNTYMPIRHICINV